jgi:NADPH2 dehydrogenase
MEALFSPLRLGRIELQHRVVMGPTTRFRADENHIPLPMMAEYYGQRASVPGTLLFTEATYVSPEASGYENAPALYNAAQIEGWKRVTDAVHAKGSFIFVQLWAMGRAADPKVLAEEGAGDLIAPSAIPMDKDAPTPRALLEEEIYHFINQYVQASKNAMVAGFDGVEVHAANGYLTQQFLEESSNQRTDAWGGSIEKRSRFLLEVTKAVVNTVGADRVGIRLSPWNLFQGMCQTNPVPQYSHLVSELKKMKLAYLSLVESRINGIDDMTATGSLDFLLDIWGRTSPVLLCGGFKAESAVKAVETNSDRTDVAILFSRWFTSNPDLPFRIQRGIALSAYHRDDFYRVASAIGYVDQPFSKEFTKILGPK